MYPAQQWHQRQKPSCRQICRPSHQCARFPPFPSACQCIWPAHSPQKALMALSHISSSHLSSLFILLLCLFIPENPDFSHTSTIFSSFLKLICLPLRHRTFASLSCLDIIAEYASYAATALTPFILLAAMHMPVPVPQISIPRAFFFLFTILATFFA